MPWAREAKRLLAEDWGVDAAVWSVTSWGELRRDGRESDEHNFLHPEEPARQAFVSTAFAGAEGPFVATSDYDNLVPDLIRPWVPGPYYTLGADGFGLSDTRRAARRFFHIDAESLVVRTLQALADQGSVDHALVRQAIDRYALFDYTIQADAPDHNGEE